MRVKTSSSSNQEVYVDVEVKSVIGRANVVLKLSDAIYGEWKTVVK